MEYMGFEYAPPVFPPTPPPSFSSGYLQSCRDIVTCARYIANTTTVSIPELYALGPPPVSAVAFGSRDSSVNVYEVGDRMSKKGWHLNALSRPAAVHIACKSWRLHFGSQGVCGGSEECAGEQRDDGCVVR